MSDIEQYLNSLCVDTTTEIDISGKNLDYLPDMSRFTKLESLNCSNNRLVRLNQNAKGEKGEKGGKGGKGSGEKEEVITFVVIDNGYVSEDDDEYIEYDYSDNSDTESEKEPEQPEKEETIETIETIKTNETTYFRTVFKD